MPSFEDIKARLDGYPRHSPPDRDQFLHETCGGDDSLMKLATALFDEKFPSESGIHPAIEKRIGAYKLECELGRGGMGIVFLASRDDEQYRKKVAIKLLQPGHGGDEVVRRFQNERQILANLDHPHICRLYDGGVTPAGEPYFVMEYIREAQPIDEYCTAHKLPLRARLELFRQACAAVQYAHRFLVVHRDLKPSNILVSEEGEVKLMDFGIAKNLLDSFGAGTAPKTIGMMPMTPAYASPEQVKGEPISTSSDVYSLGVVLYEILTGRHPFQKIDQPLPDLLHSICETEPARPSATAGLAGEEGLIRGKQLQGDLDWIVLMALRKDPMRRYGSVEQFSEDIGRYLEGRPVSARKDTIWYRAVKFAGRNKAGVGAVALIIASLAGGIVSTRMEQARTKARFNDVRQLANTLLFQIGDAIRDLPGSTPARMLLVKSSLTYLDKLAGESSGELSLQLELAEAYRKIGTIQYAVGVANVGDIAGALGSAQKELSIREWIAVRDGGVSSRLALARAHHRMSDLLEGTGDPTASTRHLDQAMSIREALFAADPKSSSIRAELASTYRAAGDKMKLRSNPVEAIALNRKAMSIREGLLAEGPKDRVTRRELSMDLVRIADSLGSPNDTNLGEYAEARKIYEQALDIRQSLLAAAPASPMASRDVCNVLQRMGSMLIEMGDYQESLARSRKALGILDQLWTTDPANFEVRRDIAVVHNQIGRVLDKMHEAAASEQSLRRSLAVYLELLQRNPKSDRSQDDVSGARNVLGGFLIRSGRATEALSGLEEARASLRELLARNPDTGRYQVKLMRTTAYVAAAYEQQHDTALACREYHAALELSRKLAESGRLSAADKGEPARLAKAITACKR